MKVSVSKTRRVTIYLDDRFGDWRSSISRIKNKLECLESIIGALEVQGLVGRVAEILMKAFLNIRELPGGLEGANEPGFLSCPKIKAAINDFPAAQLPAEWRVRGSLAGIEAESRDPSLANFRRPDIEPRLAAAPKTSAGLEVVENSFALSQLEKGIGQRHARTEGRETGCGFDLSGGGQMLLCRAPIVIPQIEEPKELVKMVKGFAATHPPPPGSAARS